MTTTQVAQIHVEVPIEEAYRHWAAVESFPDYIGAIDSVRRIDEVRSRWSATIEGVSDDFYVDIVDQTPPERLAWQSTDGVFHNGRVDLSRDGTGTRIVLRMAWEVEGDEGTGSELGDGPMQRDLERFKALVEGAAAADDDAEDGAVAS